jgi:hypothetical protein
VSVFTAVVTRLQLWHINLLVSVQNVGGLLSQVPWAIQARMLLQSSESFGVWLEHIDKDNARRVSVH